ncbi:restriction endonuclease [Geminocystis sp. NIES-3709]|uniref:restriction endonuclease n=1 Tax=Geminocystis sp. NIES-3709 TaxID=1617448 RepID=UPI0005FCB8D9|nr:restriction endonuclease [Geminocystis sp. NIES-3709]BAQ66988.1 restriction enzyme LlaI protein [Geminocystis sp. NIES-3709]
MPNTPIQKILFGCPGTGKSYRISNNDDGGIAQKDLDIDNNSDNIIKTVFHPEYTYGDFMGKLVPITNEAGKVEYNFYGGHFLRALIKAYKNMIEAHYRLKTESYDNVLLVIDEINRGNSSAIFGTVFQLLDRETEDNPLKSLKGWSSYPINLTEIEFNYFQKAIGIKEDTTGKDGNKYSLGKFIQEKSFAEFQEEIKFFNLNIESMGIRIPPNLSIIATMNTSDNSIYFMDNAFKRRWDWEYVDWDDDFAKIIPSAKYGKDGDLKWDNEWKKLVKNLNTFIKQNANSIRGGKIEDMQIGYYFIKDDFVSAEKIRNKLMFFIWDSIFNRDKTPLQKLLKVDKKDLVTFGDFIKQHNEFVINLLQGKFE